MTPPRVIPAAMPMALAKGPRPSREAMLEVQEPSTRDGKSRRMRARLANTRFFEKKNIVSRAISPTRTEIV
jgi:hypothetical protein